MTTLAKRPRLFRLTGFLSPSEVEAILSLAPAINFKKSDVSGGDGEGAKSDRGRSSETQFVSAGSLPTLRPALKRISDLIGLPHSWVINFGMQVLRYTSTAFYKPHFDSRSLRHYSGCRASYETYGRPLDDDGSGLHCPRYATILYYLSNVSGGGETCFPFADSDLGKLPGAELRARAQSAEFIKNATLKCIHHDRGALFAKPQAGDAIVWYNHGQERTDGHMQLGEVDYLAMHMAMMVGERKGNVKFAANHWFNVPWWKEDRQRKAAGKRRKRRREL
eukprot:TRINITY_DN56421_c0_g1_i1.p1 TRINITY_DN56421_c0_g1~~TRINITY_DN56421_c0_g1_i1.p1  ORF type:complete len:319 (-),score=43.98 TRINITY_DN56421_c0_g1_i1:220-1053(-)